MQAVTLESTTNPTPQTTQRYAKCIEVSSESAGTSTAT
jgi:hypothetical protein